MASSAVTALKAETTYNMAADTFDAAPLGFWARHGADAVSHLTLQAGESVLDVGCGTGASAIPAGYAVGPSGRVLGIDIAEGMLKRARVKTRQLNLDHVRFERADVTRYAVEDASVDALVSVFSIFFLPDVPTQIRRLMYAVAPGGRAVFTFWDAGAFEPAASLFQSAIASVRPAAVATLRPWERFTSPAAITATFAEAELNGMSIIRAPDRQSIVSPDNIWTLLMGSGFRWEIEALEPGEREQVRRKVREAAIGNAVSRIETSAIHAVVRKPL